MKFVVPLIAITILHAEVFSQSGNKLNDNIADYIDSMESNISIRVDTIIKYVVYGTHGEPIQHSFPVQLSFDKLKQLISATDLRQQLDGKFVYWFTNERFIIKTKRKQITADKFDIITTKYMTSIDAAFTEAIVSMSKHYQRQPTL